MRVNVLASGSKGNVTLIETKNTKILIDFGLSYKAIKDKLREINVDIEDVDGVFITHEHTDHIKGIQTLVKKLNVPIYLSQGTYEALTYKGILSPNFVVIKIDENVVIKKFRIQAFLISHDALEPFGYIVYENEKKLVYLTDTGYVSQVNEDKIRNADIYILESNHNIEMLMCTERPWPLKQRILGNFGHLCNEDALDVLNRVKGDRTKYVYLAHISEEANNYDIINLTVNNMIEFAESKLKFLIAFQHQISEVVEV